VCSPIDGSVPVTERLERAYFDLGRLDWREAIDEPGGIEFNLPISSWIRLFRDFGFDVIDYIEVQAPESATGMPGAVTASGPSASHPSKSGGSENGRAGNRSGSLSLGSRPWWQAQLIVQSTWPNRSLAMATTEPHRSPQRRRCTPGHCSAPSAATSPRVDDVR
jgi:hypothetical protein